MRLCQRVHSAVCTRPAVNRTRLAGYEKNLFRPCVCHIAKRIPLRYIYPPDIELSDKDGLRNRGRATAVCASN